MFVREMKINFKNFLIWTLILIGIFLVVFSMYPSIISSESVQSIDDFVNTLPEEMLKMFNFDISSIDSAFGWLKTEGFILVLLITGIYSGMLGSNILLKEENDKTIEYLNSLPVTRKEIVLRKFFVGFIYIILMILVLSVFNYIGLSLSGEFDKKMYLLLSITPIFPSIVIYAFCLFISTFTHKTKKTLGLSLGIVFISYFFNIISELSESTEFFKYISVFTLADLRNVIMNVSINNWIVLISIVLTLIFTYLTILRYDNKELIG